MNTRYCIIEATNIDNIDFSKVIESKDTIRYKLDGSEFIVKYIGTKPECLNEYTDLSHTDILNIVKNPALGWTNQI
tara:strand:- start:1105 stop:1332 length:228 start_codon:yes stop_codon:yes gene_type:complete